MYSQMLFVSAELIRLVGCAIEEPPHGEFGGVHCYSLWGEFDSHGRHLHTITAVKI